MAGIGFLLSPLGGAWSVFNVYASSLAARSLERRAAVLALALLQVTLVGFGLAVRAPWEVWAAGVFFGVMTGFGVLLQADLEARNRRLVSVQGEVRRLAASAERERIGRDLHDLLGHTLTLVAVKADLAARLCDRDPLAARREMEEVAAAAREALGEVRTAVVGMNGASLALEIERARVMLAAAKVDAQIRADAASPDARREAVLAMALREAVTNVIRHAGATCCTIGVDDDGSGLRLSVRDDGARRRRDPRRLRPHRHARAPGGGGRAAGGGERRGRHPAHGLAAGAGGVIRVVVAEDQSLVLGALAALLGLEDDIEVVGRATDGPSALDLALALKPDVLVSDIEMPGLTGLDVAERLKAAHAPVRVLIVTTFGRAGYLRRALDAGVRGYLLKDGPSTVLAEAVRTVARGGRAVAPELADALWDAPANPLTERERGALRLAEEGRSNRDIALALQLSPGTVRNYLSEAAQKLGAANRIEAGRIARAAGWL